MKQGVGSYLKILSLCLAVLLACSPSAAEQKLLTVAESSDFEATSTYFQVMDFIRALQAETGMMKVETLCTSPEGRKVIIKIRVKTTTIRRSIFFIMGNKVITKCHIWSAKIKGIFIR